MLYLCLHCRLAEKLRSLFTLFASHIVQHAASILEKNNKTKEGEDILINKNYKICSSHGPCPNVYVQGFVFILHLHFYRSIFSLSSAFLFDKHEVLLEIFWWCSIYTLCCQNFWHLYLSTFFPFQKNHISVKETEEEDYPISSYVTYLTVYINASCMILRDLLPRRDLTVWCSQW